MMSTASPGYAATATIFASWSCWKVTFPCYCKDIAKGFLVKWNCNQTSGKDLYCFVYAAPLSRDAILPFQTCSHVIYVEVALLRLHQAQYLDLMRSLYVRRRAWVLNIQNYGSINIREDELHNFTKITENFA